MEGIVMTKMHILARLEVGVLLYVVQRGAVGEISGVMPLST
jgi:hypothetical protein